MPDYTGYLQDRTKLRGHYLLNMMRGLPFDERLDINWGEPAPQPWGKIWQEAKSLIRQRNVSYENSVQGDSRRLNLHADIDAAALLRCVRNNPRPLFKPLLDALMKWEEANPDQSSKPTYEQVVAVIAPEKKRRHESGEGWSRPAAREFCRATLPSATNKQIDLAYQKSVPRTFTAGRKRGNRAK